MRSHARPALAASLFVAALPSAASAQLPTAILRERQLVPGGQAGERINEFGPIRVNANGSWVVQVETDAPEPESRVFVGSQLGAAPTALLRSSDDLDYERRWAVTNGVQTLHAPCREVPGFCNGELWIDDMPIAVAGDEAHAPGTEWLGQFVPILLTPDGRPGFSGSYSRPSGGFGQGIFLGSPAQLLLGFDDVPPGLSQRVVSAFTGPSSFSRLATHYISEVLLDCPACSFSTRRAVVMDGAAVMVGQGALRNGTPVDPQIGVPGERFLLIGEVGTNEAGDYFVSGSTTEGQYVIRDGAFWLRGGDPIEGGAWQTLADAVLLDNGDLCHLSFYINDAGEFVSGVFVEDRLVYALGDPVDWTGNGQPNDGYVTTQLLTDQYGDGGLRSDGAMNIYFSAWLDSPTGGQTRTAWFRLPVRTGTRYCSATPNSTGRPASMHAFGSDFASNNDLYLRAASLPVGSFGHFLTGTSEAFVPLAGGSAGTLCIGGSIGRFIAPDQLGVADGNGRIELALDLTQHPQPTGAVAVAAGETWMFTAWFRDAVDGVATSNFAGGMSITFR